MEKTQAGAVCIHPTALRKEGLNYLVSPNPSDTFQALIPLFCHDASISGFGGVHPTAVVHPTVQLGKGVQIGPQVVIDRDCSIGDGTLIHANTSIYPEVTIGDGCILHSNTTVRERSHLGNRVILQPGSVIGGCGFGYSTDETTGKHTKVKHYGVVVLEDDVEIGSNTTIDRARFKETRIRKGTKIDNLVMIAHNVQIGEDNLLVAQAGIAGSSSTGRNVILAAQTGIVGHIHLTDGTIVMAKSGISKSTTKPGPYFGIPATHAKEYKEQLIHQRRLASYVARLENLEKKLPC